MNMGIYCEKNFSYPKYISSSYHLVAEVQARLLRLGGSCILYKVDFETRA
jgi:hypothetical protein